MGCQVGKFGPHQSRHSPTNAELNELPAIGCSLSSSTEPLITCPLVDSPTMSAPGAASPTHGPCNEAASPLAGTPVESVADTANA